MASDDAAGDEGTGGGAADRGATDGTAADGAAEGAADGGAAEDAAGGGAADRGPAGGGATDDGETVDAPSDASLRSAVLWGVVGALSFAVLYQAYVLLEATFDAVALVGGTLAVGAATVALAYWLERRLAKESL